MSSITRSHDICYCPIETRRIEKLQVRDGWADDLLLIDSNEHKLFDFDECIVLEKTI